MNYGGIALVTAGALFMHAGFTGVSPLADLRSIMTTGKVASVGGGESFATYTPGASGQTVPTTSNGGGTVTITKPPLHPVVGTNEGGSGQ